MSHEIEHGTITEDMGIHEPKGVSTATADEVYVADGAAAGAWAKLEGTKVASTGETGGTKFLREDGDDTCSWQTVSITTEYASLVITDGAVAVSTIGTTAQAIDTFWDEAGPTNNVTADPTTNGTLTVSTTGDYEVLFTISFSTAAAGDAGLYQFRLRINGVESATTAYQLGMRREMSGTSDTGSGGFAGIINLTAADTVSIWVESDNGSDLDDITINECSFQVKLLRAT